jgi:hypothetical protein
MMKITLFLILFSCPLIANAYIDPGIGSTIFQAIIAGIIGGAYLVKSYWFKIIALYSKIKRFVKK